MRETTEIKEKSAVETKKDRYYRFYRTDDYYHAGEYNDLAYLRGTIRGEKFKEEFPDWPENGSEQWLKRSDLVSYVFCVAGRELEEGRMVVYRLFRTRDEPRKVFEGEDAYESFYQKKEKEKEGEKKPKTKWIPFIHPKNKSEKD